MMTEEHRRQQVKLTEQIADVVRKLFRKHVDWADIDGSTTEFVRHAVPQIMMYREESRLRSINYMHAFQAVEAPELPPMMEEPDDYDEAEAATTLLKSVRGVLKALSRKGYPVDEAMDRAEQAVASKSGKIVGDGGRNLIESEVRRGHAAVGYARVVDADPCPFCAMLASRGVYYEGKEAPGAQLYRSDAFNASNARFKGDGRFKVHDGCCCTLEPVYMKDGKITLPGNGNQLAEEWAQIASGRPDPWLAWQRWRESGTLPEDYDGPLESRSRKPPVHGQKSGRRKKPVPAKPSERKAASADSAVPEWSKADFLEHADTLDMRVHAIDAEIAALKSRGQTDRDVPVLALAHEKRLSLSRIEKYRKKAATM